MDKREKLRFLTESGIMLSLATILSLIKIFEFPYGGEVTAGSMIPIIIIALRWGVVKGLLVGAVFGVLQSIIDPFIVHPIQFLLDYPVAFSFLGLSGLFRYVIFDKNNRLSTFLEYSIVFLGIILGIFGRFISHILSGVVFFKEFAGDENVWIYSISYNAGFLGLELIITAVIILLMWGPIKDMSIGRINRSE